VQKTINFQEFEFQNIFRDEKLKETPSIFKDGPYKLDDGSIINITPEAKMSLINAFNSNVRGQRIPITKEHQDGEAYGWIDAVFAEGSEIKIKVTWNNLGYKVIDDKQLAYLSPEIYNNYTDPNDPAGTVWLMVLRCVSLTNFPRIKRLTNIREGFSESIVTETKQEIRSLDEVLEHLLKIYDEELIPHLKGKTGSPEARALYKATLNNIKSKYINKKEDKPMSDEVKKETPASITLAEMNKAIDEAKKTMEMKFAEQVTEITKQAQEKVNLAEERVKLSEQRISFLEGKLHDTEDEMILSEAIRGKDGKGRILPQDKEKWAKKLRAARKTGPVKLSETETYDSYSELVKELKEMKPVIEYGKEYGSSFTEETKEVTYAEVKKYAEQLKKDNPSLSAQEIANRAMAETGYKLVPCVKN